MSSLVLFLCAFCISTAWSMSPYALEDAEQHFEDFVMKHGKQYADESEKQFRFQIFKGHLEKIIQMNEQMEENLYSITQFMDLTHEEFHNTYTGLKLSAEDDDNPCTYLHDDDIPDAQAPESFDWREHNGVTPVKDQDQCGSCYAFSAIGNIESQYAIKHQQQIDLSEQQIVDCDYTNSGCHGGYMSIVLRYIIKAGGCMAEDDYPYQGKEIGNCSYDVYDAVVKLSDCRSYNLTSQEKLKQLLYKNGPLAIGVKAAYLMFWDGTGIITDKACNVGDVNHGVLLVGYGTENGTDFWIVKNSWGQWGQDGYFRMHRGENADSCGMMNDFMASAILA